MRSSKETDPSTGKSPCHLSLLDGANPTAHQECSNHRRRTGKKGSVSEAPIRANTDVLKVPILHHSENE